MQGSQFPISKSFLCSEALAKALEEAYGLSQVRCQLMQATMRDVYYVQSQHQSFVLFIYQANRRDAAEITAEWEFVDYLHSGGVAVAPAVRQCQDASSTQVGTPRERAKGHSRHLRQWRGELNRS